jgi:hypothetical protein
MRFPDNDPDWAWRHGRDSALSMVTVVVVAVVLAVAILWWRGWL